MGTARMSRRTRVLAAVTGVPVIAAGLWATTSGLAHASEAPAAQNVSATTSEAAPAAALETDAWVLIKASKLKGKDRIFTVGDDSENARISLSRSKPTKSDGFSRYGTWMGLTNVGTKKNPMYQIQSVNDSEGMYLYCLQQNKSGVLDLAICKKKAANQKFDFERSGDAYTIKGTWGYLKADGRELRKVKGNESASLFTLTTHA